MSNANRNNANRTQTSTKVLIDIANYDGIFVMLDV